MPNANNRYQIPLTKIIINSSKIWAFRLNMSNKKVGDLNKKGEGRFSFTFLQREISPATI
ncbi:MAG: hypothetical protein KBF82_09900 [Chitinophagaceae bacterium]|nr:hypothetical protein [Chitinophagaceae bacterium]